MSAEINNREYRQQVLKGPISQLHDDKSVDEVKDQFAAVFSNVPAEEIAQTKQALILGGLPVGEVQRLCDIHAAVLRGSVEEIHQPSDPAEIPGHPINTLWWENQALETPIQDMQSKLSSGTGAQSELKNGLTRLMEIDRYYSRKENLFFLYLEQYGVTAPPEVMWGVDNEIRNELKKVLKKLPSEPTAQPTPRLEMLFNRIAGMIFKEENILFPMLIQSLTQDEWKIIADEVADLGYCLIDNAPVRKPIVEDKPQAELREEAGPGVITLPTGILKTKELVRMLDTLPIDITFVDEDGTVKYFSQDAERVFPRTKAVIGRKVSNCHPPAGMHIVEKLVEDFRDSRKDWEDFWIEVGGKYILIRYFVVRGEAGEYLGVLEVTQNIRPMQEISGEKRLVEDAAQTNQEGIRMNAQYLKDIEFEEELELSSLIQYREGQVVSHILAQNPVASIALFSFDQGEGIGAHFSDGDAMVTMLEGDAQITIGGQVHSVTQGQTIMIPTGIPHAIAAEKPFKMLLIVVFPYPRNQPSFCRRFLFLRLPVTESKQQRSCPNRSSLVFSFDQLISPY